MRKRLQKKKRTIKTWKRVTKMTITYLSIITLISELCSNQTQCGWLDWEKEKEKKRHLYTAYKRFILKTHIDWKWRDRKRYFTQMQTSRKLVVLLGSNIHIKVDFKINSSGVYRCWAPLPSMGTPRLQIFKEQLLMQKTKSPRRKYILQLNI